MQERTADLSLRQDSVILKFMREIVQPSRYIKGDRVVTKYDLHNISLGAMSRRR